MKMLIFSRIGLPRVAEIQNSQSQLIQKRVSLKTAFVAIESP